jgi:hypothetical protein
LWNSAATLKGNAIASNSATFGWGGGLFVPLSDGATLEGNTISFNSAIDAGGGLWLNDSNATLSGNTIMFNAAQLGSGVYLQSHSDAELINNIVANNQADDAGSALYIQGSSPRLLHNTIARNTGSAGVAVDKHGSDGTFSAVSLTNTILISHSVGISVTGGNTVTVDSVLWHGTPITVSPSVTAIVTVRNQRIGDPAFAPDGYHLTAGSPAVDTGVDATVNYDLDLDLRPVGAGFDLGADEVTPPGVTASPELSTTFVYTDLQGSLARFYVPPGAVSETATLVYTPKAPQTLTGLPPDLVFGGHVFDLDALRDGTLHVPGFSFNVAVTLSLVYTDTAVADVIEDTLALYRWAGGTWEKIGARLGETFTLDIENNQLTARLLSFSRFTQLGQERPQLVFLPLVRKD